MADFRFKDLTVDNAFDFCEVLAVIGVEQVIGAFDKDEIQQLQESGTDMKEVGRQRPGQVSETDTRNADQPHLQNI